MLFGYGKRRILVADRSKGFLYTTKSLLETAGYRVKIAGNGEEALGYIEKFKYDLLVLGVSMPGIDGISLLQLVRERKRNAKVPVLFVYDYKGKETLERRRKEIAGRGQAQIKKPFLTNALLEMVDSLIEKNELVSVQRM
jgi:CheY-like chemotaxis protein